jgi:arylsulfatase
VRIIVRTANGLDKNTIDRYSTDNGPEHSSWPHGATTSFRGEKMKKEKKQYIDGANNLFCWKGETDQSARNHLFYYYESKLTAVWR